MSTGCTVCYGGLGAGLTTRSKDATFGAPGIATRSKEGTTLTNLL